LTNSGAATHVDRPGSGATIAVVAGRWQRKAALTEVCSSIGVLLAIIALAVTTSLNAQLVWMTGWLELWMIARGRREPDTSL